MAASSEKRMSEAVNYKTKLIQFFDRTTQIILQNHNGPCPLLAICNVLLLKNILSLHPEIQEISQEELVHHVVDRLLVLNSDRGDKDAANIENRQQTIDDAFNLLPRLANGMDVNMKFKEVTDFEFTTECAIFHLLGIPLYHGWIIDPQDSETYNAIGSKSYDTIMGDLVSLEMPTVVGSEYTNESVDFVAPTTATSGVSSPSLSRCLSSEDSTDFDLKHLKAKKGDLEEDAQLRVVLKMSEADILTSSKDNVGDSSVDQNISMSADESSKLEKSERVVPTETPGGRTGDEIQKSCQHELSISNDGNNFGKNNCNLITLDVTLEKDDLLSSKNAQKVPNSQPSCEESGEFNIRNDVGEKTSNGLLDFQEATVSDSCEPDPLCSMASNTDGSGGAKQNHDYDMLTPNIQQEVNQSAKKTSKIASCTVDFELDPAGGGRGKTDAGETVTPSCDGTGSGARSPEDQEPHEGEVVLAEEVDENTRNASDVGCKNGLSPEQGELVKDFLNTNASQLTVFGLIRLHEKLNDRELCVFFRNNHFSTMFKYEGQLYLLVTDQGYINQPDVVWEKLNEVSGNTKFMTGTFEDISTYDSDLQLARALQEQEYEEPQHGFEIF